MPGYPYWCTEQRPARAVRELYRTLVENSVEVPGPETAALGEAAKRANATVVVGVTERSGGTLYNTLCYFGPDGGLLGNHRKLVPTLSERTVWGMGDGSDLDAYDTPVGSLSGLICYEHFMACARYALAGLGVEVHASVWPGYPFLHANVDAATRQLAVENACAVVVAREVMSADRLPPGTPFAEHPRMWEMNGGSAIIAPGGAYLAEPVYDRRDHPPRRDRPRRPHRGEALGRRRRPLQPPRRLPPALGPQSQAPSGQRVAPVASRPARRCRVPRMPDGTPPLDFRVLNLARGVAGAYATRLLADLGRELLLVALVRPPPRRLAPQRPHADVFRAGC